MKDVRHQLNALWKQAMLKGQHMYGRLNSAMQTNTHSLSNTLAKSEKEREYLQDLRVKYDKETATLMERCMRLEQENEKLVLENKSLKGELSDMRQSWIQHSVVVQDVSESKVLSPSQGWSHPEVRDAFAIGDTSDGSWELLSASSCGSPAQPTLSTPPPSGCRSGPPARSARLLRNAHAESMQNSETATSPYNSNGLGE